jgi:hypothetical protein
VIQHTIRIAAAAALAVGSLTFVGCQSSQGPGTMTEGGGGSRDTYGNNNTDRYKVGGNMGVDTPPYGSTSSVGTNDQTSGNLYGGSSNAAAAGSNVSGSSGAQGGGTTTTPPPDSGAPTGIGGVGTSTPPAPTRPPGSGLGGPNGVGSGGASNPNGTGR